MCHGKLMCNVPTILFKQGSTVTQQTRMTLLMPIKLLSSNCFDLLTYFNTLVLIFIISLKGFVLLMALIQTTLISNTSSY